MATAKELRERITELQDEVSRMGRVVRETVEAVERNEPVPLQALREVLTGRWVNRWSMDDLLDKAQEWNETYGRPPSARDWNPRDGRATPEQRERFYSGDWPTLSQVRTHWSRWNDYMVACGFIPRTGPETRPGGSHDSSGLPEWTGWQLISHYRKRLGLTQGQLADAAGVSAGSVHQIENGRAGGQDYLPNPSIRMLMALAQALGVKTGALVED